MGTGSTLSLDDVAALIEEPASAEEQCRRFAVPVLEKSGCTRCAILRGQRSSLQIVYAAGRDGPLPLGGTPIADARVFDHLYAGEPLIHLAADPWPADVPFGPEDATLASSGAALLLPLRDESGTGGFVALLGAPRDFEASHIRKLRGLVRVLALALAKPRLHGEFERLSRASTIDALTGLLNRSSFYDRLRAEWRRASRELSPIALALLDVDYFAAYGERYGRPSADRALRAIAHTVADAGLRSSDFVARYGGSALALVMPGSEEEGALALCDRIRRAVAECAIEHSASPYGIVTASVGVASIRPNARRVPASLIFEADSALHRAKQAGRNRVASRDELRTSVAAMPRSLLPAPDTPLDREAELAELVSLHGPLLTIVGPSGSGKSRLALELARRAHERGIFVDLSQARESSVIAHVARALHVDALSPSQLVAALRDRVEHEPLLIVLDACDACGEGVAEFIKAVHGIEALRTIVTARGALGLRGEQIYELGPLA